MKIDTIGLRCPEPLMIVRQKLRTINNDEILEIVADDPSTKRDFTLLCNFNNYKLTIEEKDNLFYYTIIK
ncbi:MAG: sulfurtransferase TusA family protein [Ruminobacter sp.]|nr:sulfurtransferase TusA family protein [Ruminobacter sp.]MDY5779225.1 sulfurtransferase TusA family protein [Succinivibrionaceae bacterium]